MNDNNIENNMPIDPNATKEQRELIEEHLSSISKEKKHYERDILKWDDKSNDIVVLAKEMCLIILNMTDFMKGHGPFKDTKDIIRASQKISLNASHLEKLVKELARECPESKSKDELMGYLLQIPLFCNQLNLGSKVKEYTIDVSQYFLLYNIKLFNDKLFKKPDNASSLIISSKNLMSTVIAVVQTSYLASTKYISKTSNKKVIYLSFQIEIKNIMKKFNLKNLPLYL